MKNPPAFDSMMQDTFLLDISTLKMINRHYD